ncbi:hypothetical protein [Streptomyces sp. NPDC046685]|uniref:hypothetical protein n=1 Tax=Streptomyces sp. NPDC046685 TaxID=3157202 RepID=UPI00340865A6
MTVRSEVHDFVRLGPLPSEENNAEEGDEAFDALELALHAIEMPVTDEEAQLLVECFGNDECFGLAWTLLHLVESAPTSVVTSEPPGGSNTWVETLWVRYRNTLTD